jgi:hypothetical protein
MDGASIDNDDHRRYLEPASKYLQILCSSGNKNIKNEAMTPERSGLFSDQNTLLRFLWLITWFQLNQHIRNWEMTNINAYLLCSTLHKNNQWVPRQNKSLIYTKHRKLELELISDLQDDKTELLYWINEYQGRTSPDLQYRREVRHRREQPPQSALPLLLTSKIVHVVSLLWRIIIEPPWIWAEVIETQYPTTIAHWPCGGRRAGTVGQLQLTAGQCCLRREGHRTEIHMRWWCEMVARIQRGGTEGGGSRKVD